MERTFFFLGFCPPSIRAVWRGFNSDVANGKGGVWGGIFHLLRFFLLAKFGRDFWQTIFLSKPFYLLFSCSRHLYNTRLAYHFQDQDSKNLHAFHHSVSFAIFHFWVYF